MKKLFKYACLASVAMMAASCAKDDTTDFEGGGGATDYLAKKITIEAQTGSEESRTSMDTDAKKLVWQTAEEELSIAVVELWDDELTAGVTSFDSARISEAECSEVSGGKAIFSGTVQSSGDATTFGYIAAYPHAAFKTLSGTNLTVTLPAAQTPAAVDDIDPAATLLFASALEGAEETSANLDLYFRHIAAYGRIRIHDLELNSGDKIKSIVVSADEALAGEWSFNYTDEEPAGSAGSETSNEITLNVSGIDTSAAATAEGLSLYFSALPVGEVNNFSVKVVTDAGLEYVKTAAADASISFERKVVKKVAVDFSGVAPVLPESQTEKLIIISGNTSWPGASGNPFENLFNGIIADDATNGEHYHTDWNNPKGFPVTLDFTLESSYVSSVRYYTRDGNGKPGKFDVLYRQNGQDDFTPVSKNYDGTSANAQYDMKESHHEPYFNIPLDELLENVVEIRLQFYNGSGDSGGYISGREVEIFGKPYVNNIVHDKLKIVSGVASEYQSGEGIENLFDGDLDNKLYHSPYNGVQEWPVELTFTLAANSDVSCMHYYTRPAGSNGLPGKFDVHYRTSASGEWIPAVSGKGGSADNAMFDMGKKIARPYILNFDQTLENAAEIKLSVYNGNENFVSGAEVEFFGKCRYKKLALTADNFTCPFVGENTLADLCDDNAGTFMGTVYWGREGGADYDGEDWDPKWIQFAPITAVWGVYVDIALPAAASDMLVYLTGRNGNGTPVDVILGKSTDGENYEQYAEATGLSAAGKRVNVSEYHGDAVKHIRLGVTKSNMGDLKTSPAKSMAIAELEVWVKD